LFRSENTECQIPASTSPTAERLSQLVEPDAFVQNAVKATKASGMVIDDIGVLSPSLMSCVGSRPEVGPNLTLNSQRKSDDTSSDANHVASINEDRNDIMGLLVQNQRIAAEDVDIQVKGTPEKLVFDSHLILESGSHASVHNLVFIKECQIEALFVLLIGSDPI
jgi:hypothetical protein